MLGAITSTACTNEISFSAEVKETDAPKGAKRGASRKTFLRWHCARNDGKVGHGRGNEVRLGVRWRTMRPVTIHRYQSPYRPVIGSFFGVRQKVGSLTALRVDGVMIDQMSFG